MDKDKCNCSMSISVLGDGCRYCQPQECIDRMQEGIDEDNAELDKANARIAQLEAALALIADPKADIKTYQGDGVAPNLENIYETIAQEALLGQSRAGEAGANLTDVLCAFRDIAYALQELSNALAPHGHEDKINVLLVSAHDAIDRAAHNV